MRDASPLAADGREVVAAAPPAPPAPAHSLSRGLHLLGRRAIAALAVGVVGSTALGFVELVVALFLQLFLQRIGVVTQPLDLSGPLRGYRLSTRGLVYGLLAIAVVRGFAQFLVTRGAVVALEAINARLRRLSVYEMLLDPGRRYVPASLVNARIGEIFPKAAYFCFFGATFLASVAQGVVLVAIMMSTAWRETLIALAGLVVVGVIVLRINERTRIVSALVPKEQYILTEGIERVARNVLLVRALRTERQESRRFVDSIETYALHSTRAHSLSATSYALTPLLALVLLLVIILASQRVLHTPGLALLSFLYLFIRFAQNLALMVQMFSQLNQNIPQMKDAFAYLLTFSRDEVDLALHDRGARPATGNAPDSAGPVDTTDPVGPAFQITRVAYSYPNALRDALSDVTAIVPAGSQFAVVGPSGAGKSTLLALLLGVLEPVRGSVSIDGRDPRHYFADPAVRVGYVGAEPFLIAGSVRENICYGLSRAVNEGEIDLALERARLRGVIDDLPGGLAYRIAEDGSGLSGGQKQRLCLARAVLNRPHVLVLDEVSANLDSATESEIAESLRALRGRCTTIIVSHRSALLKYADTVLELLPTPEDRGTAAGQGQSSMTPTSAGSGRG
jgi:ABC-type multidrug transport system fused ATPase/permease subunit